MLSVLVLMASVLALALTWGTPQAGLARLALAAAVAMGAAAYFTPRVARAACRFGIVDRPDGRLKDHTAPVPYLGGLAVGLPFFLSLAILFRFDQRMTGILLAGAIALLLGLVDDLGAMSWKAKFAGQALGVLVLVKTGVVADIASLPPAVNVLLSVVWLLGLTNALNLIDISDGLAPGVALFAAGAFVVAALFDGAALLAILAATLFGALAGFVPHNFAPARIYLGDAGSMFLGLTLGGISLAGAYTRVSAWGLAVPVLILAVPLFDTAYVVTLRLLHGRNPFLGSPDHLAVRLRRLGWNASSIAVGAVALTVFSSAAGLLLMFLPPSLAPWLVSGVVLVFVVIGVVLARVDVTTAVSVSSVAGVNVTDGAPDLTTSSRQDRPDHVPVPAEMRR
ncbi:MAG: MraY family glycosyltransferase [Acidobacteriota bacterium]